MKKSSAFICMALFSIGLSAQTINTLPANGDIGIGTSNPVTKLQVCGKSQFDANVLIKDTLQVTKDLIIDQNVIVNGDIKLTNHNGTGYDLLWIDEFGKIVRGGGPSLGNILLDNVYTPECIENPDGSQPNPGWNNRTGVIFTHEVCPDDVKIGITTSNPEARVHIVEKTVTGDILKLSTFSNPDIMVVENDGKLGLGLNNPDSRLHIKGPGNFVRFDNANGATQFKIDNGGKVFCREVKVTLGTIADYVYDESYNLMTIEEYETYTKTNKHLPGIPSQKEVEENGGIDIGEFQVKLLEKIEEMSLYLFELKKQNDELQNEMQKLKMANAELENKVNDFKK